MILGIDPGLHGALVLYDPATHRIVRAANVPTFQIIRNGKSKGTVNIMGVVALVRTLKKLGAQYAFLELVGPMPKQGVSSVWSFCRGDTSLETAVVGCYLPFERVSPRVWQKAVGAPPDDDGSILRANQLMPKDAHLWTPNRNVLTKKDAAGIADAALIAYYGAQKFTLTGGCAPSYNGIYTPT